MKKTKRTALFEKKEVDSYLCILFINVGIEEIMFTNLWSMLFLLHFVYKDLFFWIVFLLRRKKIEEPNRSTNPWLLRNISALPCGRNVLF